MRLIMLLVLAVWYHAGMTEVINIETDSFAKINSLYHDKVTDHANTLLVFDIDETLLTMSQPLGSVAWWDWQSELLRENNNSSKLVAHTMHDLVEVQNLLFQLMKMNVTDQYVVPFIKEASEQGASVMGLTARGRESLSVTLSQLTENGFVDKQNQLLFHSNGPKLSNQDTVSGGDLNCSSLTGHVSYYQGIVFLGNQNKGQALRCIVTHSAKHYNTILFVDDVANNVEAVAKEFSNQADINVFNVRYTRGDSKKQLFLHTEALQDEADTQWKNIKRVLEQNIQQPALNLGK